MIWRSMNGNKGRRDSLDMDGLLGYGHNQLGHLGDGLECHRRWSELA